MTYSEFNSFKDTYSITESDHSNAALWDTSAKLDYQSIRQQIEGYQQRGWAPFPVKSRSKEPSRQGWQNSTPQTATTDFFPGCNVAINLGELSGGLVIIDLDSPEAVKAAPYFLPDTGLIFGRGSEATSHWAYRVPDCGRKRAFETRKEGKLVEYLAAGASCIFPPSVYDNGETAVFESNGEPAGIGRDDLLGAAGIVAACALVAQGWNHGNRHQMTLALAGALGRARWTEAKVRDFVEAICAITNDPETDDRLRAVGTTLSRLATGENVTGLPTLADMLGSEVAERVSEWLRLPSSSRASDFDYAAVGHNRPPGTDTIPLTEVGNADRFIRQHGSDAKFCSDLGSWFVWRGGRWEQDKSRSVKELAERTVRSIYFDVDDAKDSRYRDEILKWGRASCSNRVIEATLSLAIPRLSLSVEKFDADRLLLNFKNGTVDLRTGRLREHRREDWITKQVPYDFDANAACPTFLRFIDEITGSDQDLVDFLHRAFGYSLTGLTDAQCMFIAYGDGANGKSTLLNLFYDLLGDYSKNTPVQTFTASKTERTSSDDLARLRGARFVTAAEAEATQSLAEALLKRVTGGDTITARHLYGGYFDFKPQFKLWMSTNNRLKISGTDKGIWRRIREIPFGVTFAPDKQDPALSDKLKAEASGILAWAVRGFLEYQTRGLTPPMCVQQATEAYREEMDIVGQFLAERMVSVSGARTSKADAHSAFQQWADTNGHDQISKPELGKRLKRRGIKETKSGPVAYWAGLKIVEHRDGSADPVEGEAIEARYLKREVW